MHISSLYIHDYFLESIRRTWLIQMVVLIEVLSVSTVDFPAFISQCSSSSLSFYVDLILTSLSPSVSSVNLSCSPFYSRVLQLIGCDRLYPFSSTWLTLVVREWRFWPFVSLWWEVAWLLLSSIIDPEENVSMIVIIQGSLTHQPTCLKRPHIAVTALHCSKQNRSSGWFAKSWLWAGKKYK